MVIYTVWGVRPGDNYETLLIDKINTGDGLTDITDITEAEKIKKYLETVKRCNRVRIARVDLKTVPDFAGAIN